MTPKEFESFSYEANSASQIDFEKVDFSKGWDVCKKHGLTKGLSKTGIITQRPGYVAMWLNDLARAGRLSKEDTDYLIFPVKTDTLPMEIISNKSNTNKP